MDQSIVASAKVAINRPALIVWMALTDPAVIKQYFFGMDVESTWIEGSPVYYHGEYEGKKIEDKGTVVRCVPTELLETTYWTPGFGPDKPENYACVTYKLSGLEDNTELTVTQAGNKDKEGAKHSAKNWQMVLDKMKQLLES